MIKIYIGPHVRYPLYLSEVNETLICSTYLRKKNQILNVIKIRE